VLRLLAVVAAVSLGGRPAAAGVSSRIHSPEQVLRDHTRLVGPSRLFTDASGRSWEMVTDVGDPAIANKGSGVFHPIPVATIEDALDQVTASSGGLTIEIFVLPFPRRDLLASSADGSSIYLSPGVQPWSAEQVHALVIHELGHVVQHEFLPDDDPAWQEYRRLRGITDEAVYAANAIHRNRPHEIFAEDFRALFGGVEANYSGSIENSDLGHPEQVAGLRKFFTGIINGHSGADGGLFALRSAPNPFRPRTTIRFVVPSGRHEARLDVFSVEGRLVRGLLKEPLEGGERAVEWDGRDDLGRDVAAGIYFARVAAGGGSSVIRLVRVR
jgi:hypothetical protein